MPKKVDLDGVELELDDEIADKVIAARQSQKERLRTLSEQVSALSAKEAEAKAAAAAAAQEAEVAKLTSKGEYEAALKKATEQHGQTIGKLKANLKATALKSAILKTPGVITEAADDILSLTGSVCDYDLETGKIVIIGEGGRPRVDSEGQPLSVDAFLGEILEKRPYLRAASSAPGSGATFAPPPKGPPVKAISQEEYDARMRDPAQSLTTSREINAGRLKVH